MTLRKAILFAISSGMIGALAGCSLSGSSSIAPPTPFVYVLFTDGPPSTLPVNASTTIEAATENSPQNNRTTYAVACACAGACGTFSPSQYAGAVVYTAPAAIPSGGTVTITATSVFNPAKSASASIAIVPPIPIAVTFTAAVPASLQINSAITLSATTVNDTATRPEVQWAASCGGTECGSITPATASAGAVAFYSAPAAIPPGNTVTITATSVTDRTKSASATIAITAQTATLANGTYVFQLTQSIDSVAIFTTGVIVARNGAITGGEQDFMSYFPGIDSGGSAPYYFFSPITGGNYAITPDGNLEITYSSGGITFNLLGTLASGSEGFVAQLCSSLGNGILVPQTGTAAPSGGYAISVVGNDGLGNPASMGGILNIDSPGGISGAGSVLDDVDAENLGFESNVSKLQAGTVSAPDLFGRIEIQLNTGQIQPFPAQNLTGYIVDSRHILLISAFDDVDGTSYGGVMGGLALGQGPSTGHFSASSITASSYAFGASGIGQNGSLQAAGVFTASAGGSLTGSLNWIDMTGGEQNPRSFTGSWTIDPTGRATLSDLNDGSALDSSLHLYLTGDGNALLLSNDSADIFAGQAFQRQSAPFTASTLSGNYGFDASGQGTSPLFGSVTAVDAADGTDTLTGFLDTGNGILDLAVSGSLTPASNGVFAASLTGFDAASLASASSFTFYLVDNTRAVAIETDKTRFILGYLQLQNQARRPCRRPSRTSRARVSVSAWPAEQTLRLP